MVREICRHPVLLGDDTSASAVSSDALSKYVFLMQEMCWHLVFAGHDTSASSLSMMLHYLKKEPWVLEKLRAEQRQVNCL